MLHNFCGNLLHSSTLLHIELKQAMHLPMGIRKQQLQYL